MACLVLTYYVQTCCYFIWNATVFPHNYPEPLTDYYFGYLNLLEFSWFLFARSRLTLKYYPKLATLSNLAFLVFINSYDYAPSVQSLTLLFTTTFLVLALFVLKCELPAMHSWSPFD